MFYKYRYTYLLSRKEDFWRQVKWKGAIADYNTLWHDM